jgi:tol-pal system protein YbgF
MNKILLSYRREDSADITGRIYDRLVTQFGRDSLFKDVDSIPFGVDFRTYLDSQVATCHVFLAVIGPDWMKTRAWGKSRLEDPKDFVRIEVESALKRGIPVIPVLVRGSTIPVAHRLPISIRDLAYRQGIAVRPDPDFHRDMDRLIEYLKRQMQLSHQHPAGQESGITLMKEDSHILLPVENEELSSPGKLEPISFTIPPENVENESAGTQAEKAGNEVQRLEDIPVAPEAVDSKPPAMASADIVEATASKPAQLLRHADLPKDSGRRSADKARISGAQSAGILAILAVIIGGAVFLWWSNSKVTSESNESNTTTTEYKPLYITPGPELSTRASPTSSPSDSVVKKKEARKSSEKSGSSASERPSSGHQSTAINKMTQQNANASVNEAVPMVARESDMASAEAPRQSSLPKPSPLPEPTPIVPGVPSITPTSAFNLAYNDYLNGKYDLAVTGFQRFIKDFPSTALTPNAHYWLGESFYGQKDYVRAMQAFEYVATEYPGDQKVPAALLKLGLAATETGDSARSRKFLKRVIEEYPTSDEAKLAKIRMAKLADAPSTLDQGQSDTPPRGHLLNVNTASASDMILVLGLSREVSDRIIANRPYRVKGELVAKNVLSKEAFDFIKDRITIRPESDTLVYCIDSIPKDATVGLRMIAEETCKRNEAARR